MLTYNETDFKLWNRGTLEVTAAIQAIDRVPRRLLRISAGGVPFLLPRLE